MPSQSTLAAKIRTLRRQHRLTQTELARRLGVSPSYVNLIEHNRRAFRADLLVRLAQVLPIDLKSLGSSDGAELVELLEVLGDPMFEHLEIVSQDVREMASSYPAAAAAVVQLYEAFRRARQSAQELGDAVSKDAALQTIHLSRFPSEEVSDLIQQHLNYFPELELGAERLVRDANLDSDAMYTGLATYLQRVVKVKVRIEPREIMQGAVRTYDPERRVLVLSEGLRPGRRNFHLAFQIGLLTQGEVITRVASDPVLTTDQSRATCRVSLANYFAAAVLMPYDEFLAAARRGRYDIELLGHRFDCSFEQTCHRLTTLQRPGAEGIPLHMMRVDIAGNMSKHFSLSGLQIPRFSGACPRWNTFKALLTPGLIHTQLSQMPDGKILFGVARTIHSDSVGFNPSRPPYAVGIGCDVSRANEMVYADGLSLTSREGIVPVGPSCRLCDRTDCEDRAYPPLHHQFPIDENRRGISFYAPPPPIK